MNDIRHTHTPRAARPARPARPALPVVLLLTAVLVLLSACGPVATGTGALRTASPSTRLRIWYGTDDPVESAWAQTLARRFTASNPAAHVTLTTYGLDDLNTKMQLALRAGNPPDLVYTTPRGPGLPAYVRAGQLRDLSAEARRYGWAAQ